MAYEIHSTGTADLALDVEATLATVTDLGVFVMQVDVNQLQAGDVLVLRRYQRATDGGTYRLAEAHTLSDDQAEDIAEFLPVHSGYGVSWRLEQTDGVARDFPWVLKEVS